jgi:hypothetical protein
MGGEQNNIQLQHLFSESITTTSRKPTVKHQQSSLQLLWCLESSAVDCTMQSGPECSLSLAGCTARVTAEDWDSAATYQIYPLL